jgi:hypothetical protein
MTTTIVVWAADTPGPEANQLIREKASQMALEGKTDDVAIRETVGTEQVTTRTWTTLADAEEWILFVEQYSPVSATIQS